MTQSRFGRASVAATLVTTVVCLAACSGSAPKTATIATAPPTSATTTTVGAPPATTATTVPPPNLTLSIEPADRYGSVYQMIGDSRHSLDITMYELADPQVVSLLTAAHRRGVAVRVLLDRAGGGAGVNQAAFDQLSAQGVPVRWAPSAVTFHQKTVTADRTVSAILTGNLTAPYYPTTRDFVVFDRSPAAVSSIERIFTRDWNGAAATRVPGVAGLVWSPGAAPALVSLIDSARRTLTVENEAMASTPVISALKAAGRRGVLVKVVMTDSPAWHSVWTGLTRAGVEVATYPNTPGSLDIHAKVMVADDLTAFVGSQIFSKTSLSYSRELGLTTSDAAVVAPLSQTLAADFAGGTRFHLKHPTIARGTGHTTTTTRAIPATTTTTRAP